MMDIFERYYFHRYKEERKENAGLHERLRQASIGFDIDRKAVATLRTENERLERSIDSVAGLRKADNDNLLAKNERLQGRLTNETWRKGYVSKLERLLKEAEHETARVGAELSRNFIEEARDGERMAWQSNNRNVEELIVLKAELEESEKKYELWSVEARELNAELKQANDRIEELQIELGIAEQQPDVVVDLQERIEELERFLNDMLDRWTLTNGSVTAIEAALKKT